MTYTTSYSIGTVRSRFAANTYTAGDQHYADLAPLLNGGFVVGYDTILDFLGPNFAPSRHFVIAEGKIESIATFDTGTIAVLVRNGSDERVQLFNPGGHQLGATIDVHDSSFGARITTLADGKFVLTYQDGGSGSDSKVFIDEYDASGQVIVSRRVDSATGDQFSDDGVTTRLADGGFVTTYSKFIGDYQYDVWGAVFNADGSVRTADHVIVGAGSDKDYFDAVTVALDDGGYAMAYKYHSPSPTGLSDEPEEVVVRRYNSAGTELGSPLVLAHDDDSDTGTFSSIQISKLENGLIAVTWLRSLDEGGLDSYLTVLDEAGVPGAGLPTNVVLAHYDEEADYPHSDVASLLNGTLFFARTDLAVDGSGSGVAVTVRELVRTSIGTTEGDPFLGDQLADKVYAGGGADLVASAGGRDFVYGEGGEDFINGGADGDYLYGGTENDQVIGEAGDDVVSGDEGNDEVTGGAGNDIALGGDGDDTVGGGDGDDILYGEAGGDRLDGGAGADRLDGGSGADTLTGGLGNDSYVLASLTYAGSFPVRLSYDTVVEDSGRGTGTDTVIVTALTGKGAPTGYTLGDNVENGTVAGTAAFALTGNRLENVLTGNAAANRLDGGTGHDTLSGGGGDDTYVVGFANVGGNPVYDLVVEAAGAGTDTVQVRGLAAHGYKLTANVENGLVTGGDDDFQLEGNALANALTGGRGAERLIGGAGNDTLTGGAGADRFVFQNVAAGTQGGWGSDLVTDFRQGTDLLTFFHTDVTRFRDLTITDHAGNALIATAHGDTIELVGVAAATVRASDFEFVPAAFAAPVEGRALFADHPGLSATHAQLLPLEMLA